MWGRPRQGGRSQRVGSAEVTWRGPGGQVVGVPTGRAWSPPRDGYHPVRVSAGEAARLFIHQRVNECFEVRLSGH